MATKQTTAQKSSAPKTKAPKTPSKKPLTRGAQATPAAPADDDGRGAIAVVREAPER